MRRRLWIWEDWLVEWRNVSIPVKRAYGMKINYSNKLFSRNCKCGKKYKAFAYMVKSLHLIHLFMCRYGVKRLYKKRFRRFGWRKSLFLYCCFLSFFSANKPIFTKKIRIRKKQPNRYINFQVWENKMPAELWKWFWLLSFCQPFKKVYQRFSFIFLEVIFFAFEKNIFDALISKVRPTLKEIFKKKTIVRKCEIRRYEKLSYCYLGKLNV